MGCVYCKCCPRLPSSSPSDGKKFKPKRGKTAAGADELLEVVHIPSHDFKLEYSVLTRRGYYPDMPNKENQDCFCIKTSIQGNPNAHFFGVFDGHGHSGKKCSNFVKNRLLELLCSDDSLLEDPVKAYTSAFCTTNNELHDNPEIDDVMSGTTAITVLVIGDKLFVANVGDSRAVISVKEGDHNRIVAQDLSYDQTPFRNDELERVKDCGARVLSVDQVEGVKDPSIQSWGDEESAGSDPPRLWVPNGMYPGTAFTRSIGDSLAEKIGVVAVPEVCMVQLTANHPFFLLASDGVDRYIDPRNACCAVSAESYKLWLEHENRTDDITIIVVHINGLSNSDVNDVEEAGGSTLRPRMLKSDINPEGGVVIPVLEKPVSPPGSEMFQSVVSDIAQDQKGGVIHFLQKSDTSDMFQSVVSDITQDTEGGVIPPLQKSQVTPEMYQSNGKDFLEPRPLRQVASTNDQNPTVVQARE
ncbi:Protein phosphatase 2C [Cynara cardunculus var. scolymus]|uniref:protein-serine/threonine phosphatase n=1 Tax=Cynara cardunculus var. scolymus TaxID=59895 RepID=A0A103XFM4_CYNCS|nr:Protein phosphatase 2C [Cynara cardunculus var. scolymus]